MDNYVIPTLHDMELTKKAKGNRHYVLAHFWLKDDDYCEYFRQVRKEDPTAWITLDNSAAEKDLVDIDTLIDIVGAMEDMECLPNEVIPPDILGDMTGTLHNFYTFINQFQAYEDVGIFACPQGSTKEEWLTCYDVMRLHPRVLTIGLSKITVPRCFMTGVEGDGLIKEGRHRCIDTLIARNTITKPLHFLGMGDCSEYLYYKHHYPVMWESGLLRSTDSCYCVLAAVHGIDFQAQFETRGQIDRVDTYNEFYEKPLTADQKKLALKNINFLSWLLD